MLTIVFYILILIFIILSLMDVHASETTADDHRTKPLLMPVLLCVYLAGRGMQSLSVNGLIVTALIMGFLGDTLLLKKDSIDFILAGVLGFLMCHLLYLMAFLRDAVAFRDNLSVIPLVQVAIGEVAYMYVFGRPLMNRVDRKLAVAGVVYTVMIALMSLSAFARCLGHTDAASIAVDIGAIFFIVSDSLLARSYTLKKPHHLVMATYLPAQFLIVLGMVFA